MRSEFDRFASDYSEMLRDPIKDHFALNYGFFVLRKWALLQEFVVRHGWRTAERSWLDVGCGRGELLRLGRSCFARAAGCDVSEQMLKECGDVEVRRQLDPAEVPYEDASQDLVTVVNTLHHVSGDVRRKLLLEVARVLRPAGVVCVIEHSPWNPVTRRIVGRAAIDVNAELLSGRAAQRLLRGAGFRVMETEYFLLLPERFFRRFGLVERWLARLPLGGQYAVFGRRQEGSAEQ